MLRLLYRSEGKNRIEPFGEGETVTIGRAPDNTIVLTEQRVSGHHAQIVGQGTTATLRDTDSRNGTWLNEQRVESEEVVHIGDQIEIGGTVFRMLSDDTTVTFVENPSTSERIVASLGGRDDTRPITMEMKEETTELRRAHRMLGVLHEMGDILLDVKKEDEFGERILDLVFRVVPAERACVIIRSEDGDPVTAAVRFRTDRGESLEISRTILNRTLDEGVSLLTGDAVTDSRFQSGHSVILQGIRSAMCAPLRGKEAAVGAIYADSRSARKAFTEEHLELLTTLGILGGITVENLRLMQRILKSDRLETMGGVIAGLSHDVRNVLTLLKGGAWLLDQLITESKDPNLQKAWEAMRSGTDTVAALVEDMVSFSKEREPEKVATNVNRIVRDVANRHMSKAREQDIDIEIDMDLKLPEAEVDPTAIDRLLTNLVTNALDALGEGPGRVTLATQPAAAPFQTEIRVWDNGPGIPRESLGRIFDLLFSTKGSKGTGFGLAVAKKIVEEHGGRLTAGAGPEGGAEFRIVLP